MSGAATGGGPMNGAKGPEIDIRPEFEVETLGEAEIGDVERKLSWIERVWNVNGVRAAQRKGFLDWLHSEQPDILGLCETKAAPEQLDDALRRPEGYHAWWAGAERKGYSGTALLSRRQPRRVEIGLGIEEYDVEGRTIVAGVSAFPRSPIQTWVATRESGRVTPLSATTRHPGRKMAGTTECVVDILRRCGPGMLPARQLRRELLRRRPAVALSMERLRTLVEESEDRLLHLRVELDTLEATADMPPLACWILVTAPEDAPDRPRLARSLWESLAALALDVDPASRVEVCRWALKAEQARRSGAEEDPWGS